MRDEARHRVQDDFLAWWPNGDVSATETEAIRHFRNSLRDSGRACAAESKVRALEAERDRGKWHGGPLRG